MHRLIPIFPLLLLGCSINSPDDDVECDGNLDLKVASQAPDTVEGDLVVRGTASPSRNTAIRSLTVAGVEATPETFNYKEWSVVVPFAALLALPTDAAAPDDVVIPIRASPSCGDSGQTELTVHLNRHANVRVDSLTLQASFPAGRTYLPADGSAAGLLEVTANPEGRGALISLAAVGGAVFPGASDTFKLTLAGDGVSGASASAVISAGGAGTLFITATGDGTAATPLSVVAAAAPRLFPAAAKLKPGQALKVTVVKSVESQIADCQPSSSPGLDITTDVDGETYTVQAADDLDEAVEAKLTCRDDYGQKVLATYSAAP
jgi:hypothetical protein